MIVIEMVTKAAKGRIPEGCTAIKMYSTGSVEETFVSSTGYELYITDKCKISSTSSNGDGRGKSWIPIGSSYNVDGITTCNLPDLLKAIKEYNQTGTLLDF